MLVDAAYGDKTLSISQINRIIKAVKEGKTTVDLGHSNPKQTRKTDDVMGSITATVEENLQVTIRELATTHGPRFGIIQAILTDNLGLVKKFACWVPRLLSTDQKNERVQCSNAFLDLIWQQSQAVLNNIVTMDVSAVLFHTPETKNS
jgi:hypothetical protein